MSRTIAIELGAEKTGFAERSKATSSSAVLAGAGAVIVVDAVDRAQLSGCDGEGVECVGALFAVADLFRDGLRCGRCVDSAARVIDDGNGTLTLRLAVDGEALSRDAVERLAVRAFLDHVRGLGATAEEVDSIVVISTHAWPREAMCRMQAAFVAAGVKHVLPTHRASAVAAWVGVNDEADTGVVVWDWGIDGLSVWHCSGSNVVPRAVVRVGSLGVASLEDELDRIAGLLPRGNGSARLGARARQPEALARLGALARLVFKGGEVTGAIEGAGVRERGVDEAGMEGILARQVRRACNSLLSVVRDEPRLRLATWCLAGPGVRRSAVVDSLAPLLDGFGIDWIADSEGEAALLGALGQKRGGYDTLRLCLAGYDEIEIQSVSLIPREPPPCRLYTKSLRLPWVSGEELRLRADWEERDPRGAARFRPFGSCAVVPVVDAGVARVRIDVRADAKGQATLTLLDSIGGAQAELEPVRVARGRG